MKIQAILFASLLLQAQTVLSSHLRVQGSDAVTDGDDPFGVCVSRCKRLRFSIAMQDTCIHCCDEPEDECCENRLIECESSGDREDDLNNEGSSWVQKQENEDNDADTDEEAEWDAVTDGQCVRDCMPLHYSREKHLACIECCQDPAKCSTSGEAASTTTTSAADTTPEDDGSWVQSEEDSTSTETSSTSAGVPEWGPQQCEARCRRLRFSHRMQLQCIHCCHSPEDECCEAGDCVTESDRNDEGRVPKKDEDNGNGPSADGRDSDGRLPKKNEDTAADSNGEDRSDGNNDADADGEPEWGPQQCEARCRRLRFSHRMQLQCIHCCHNLDDEECNPNGEGEAYYAMTY